MVIDSWGKKKVLRQVAFKKRFIGFGRQVALRNRFIGFVRQVAFKKRFIAFGRQPLKIGLQGLVGTQPLKIGLQHLVGTQPLKIGLQHLVLRIKFFPGFVFGSSLIGNERQQQQSLFPPPSCLHQIQFPSPPALLHSFLTIFVSWKLCFLLLCGSVYYI